MFVWHRQTELWVKAQAEHSVALPGLNSGGTPGKWCCISNLPPSGRAKAGSRSSFPQADEGEHPQVLWMWQSSTHHSDGTLGWNVCLARILLQSSPDGQASRCFLQSVTQRSLNFYSLDGLGSNTCTNKSPDVCSLWLRTSLFPHPSSLASSYRYLISCVDCALPSSLLTHVSCCCWVEQHRQRGGGWSLWSSQTTLLPEKLGDKNLQEGDQNTV